MAKFNVVIDESARAITPDQLCRCVTGMTTEQLAKDIMLNRNGKYDFLYKKPLEKSA